MNYRVECRTSLAIMKSTRSSTSKLIGEPWKGTYSQKIIVTYEVLQFILQNKGKSIPIMQGELLHQSSLYLNLLRRDQVDKKLTFASALLSALWLPMEGSPKSN